MGKTALKTDEPKIDYDRIDRLKKTLRYLGLRQRDLGAKLEIDERQVSHWLTGFRSISERTILRICELYPDISEQWLMSGTGTMLKNGLPEGEESVSAKLDQVLEKLDELSRLIYGQMEKDVKD